MLDNLIDELKRQLDLAEPNSDTYRRLKERLNVAYSRQQQIQIENGKLRELYHTTIGFDITFHVDSNRYDKRLTPEEKQSLIKQIQHAIDNQRTSLLQGAIRGLKEQTRKSSEYSQFVKLGVSVKPLD